MEAIWEALAIWEAKAIWEAGDLGGFIYITFTQIIIIHTCKSGILVGKKSEAVFWPVSHAAIFRPKTATAVQFFYEIAIPINI